MIQIIKHGVLDNKTKKFRCRVCKCKFKTDEYKIAESDFGMMCSYECPECKCNTIKTVEGR